MTRYYVNGGLQLWEPTSGGLIYPRSEYVQRLRQDGVIVDESIDGSILSAAMVAGVVKCSPKDLSRRQIFALAGAMLAGGAFELFRPRGVLAQFGGGGGGAFVITWHDDSVTGVAPLDASTYYYGNGFGASTANTYLMRIVVPVACTLIKFIHIQSKTGTASSTELVSHYVRKNDTTDSTGVTGAWDNAAGTPRQFTETLSLSFAAGDDAVPKIVTPTWATNPTGVRLYGVGYFTF